MAVMLIQGGTGCVLTQASLSLTFTNLSSGWKPLSYNQPEFYTEKRSKGKKNRHSSTVQQPTAMKIKSKDRRAKINKTQNQSKSRAAYPCRENPLYLNGWFQLRFRLWKPPGSCQRVSRVVNTTFLICQWNTSLTMCFVTHQAYDDNRMAMKLVEETHALQRQTVDIFNTDTQPSDWLGPSMLPSVSFHCIVTAQKPTIIHN